MKADIYGYMLLFFFIIFEEDQINHVLSRMAHVLFLVCSLVKVGDI